MNKIKLLDTFAGVGGFHLALEQSIGKENVECIGFSEIDKFAIQVYKERFPNSKDLGSISELDIEALPTFDLLTGGFPCQDVSVAGKQNLEGGRTVLVEYLLQILEKKPSHFVFENVKGLLSKKFKVFFDSILEEIKVAGYDVKYQILDTSLFGIPQGRERVFIVGQYGKESLNNYVFPKGNKLTVFLKDILEEKVDKKYYFSEKAIKGILKYRENYVCNGVTPTLTCELAHSRGKNITPGIMREIYNITGEYRRLTPIECERLQGFPDDWTKYVCNTQRYKQMGNTISVPVVKAIFDNLF